MRRARTSRYRRSTTLPTVTPSPPNSWTASSTTRCAVSVACSLAIAPSRLTRPPSTPALPAAPPPAEPVRRPRRAIDEQRARVDLERHVGELRLHQLQVGHRRAEEL